MTVYVDSMRMPARVGRIQANWSHLTADTKRALAIKFGAKEITMREAGRLWATKRAAARAAYRRPPHT